MENEMTNEQFNKILQMIYIIIEQSETKEAALERIKELLNK